VFLRVNIHMPFKRVFMIGWGVLIFYFLFLCSSLRFLKIHSNDIILDKLSLKFKLSNT